jgi:hypothetical protein
MGGWRTGPNRAWAAEITDLISAFPQVSHWELGNEYDLDKKTADAEEKIQWANYRAYHKRFADVLAAVGGGELVAVENGRAGIWPEREKACVASGDFANIAVINSHHYCGVEAPELNFGNFNTGFETLHRDEAPALFFDRLRAVKRAAVSDGKARQSWLTEFGWDTLAGNVVTPYEQAAYLPRLTAQMFGQGLFQLVGQNLRSIALTALLVIPAAWGARHLSARAGSHSHHSWSPLMKNSPVAGLDWRCASMRFTASR